MSQPNKRKLHKLTKGNITERHCQAKGGAIALQTKMSLPSKRKRNRLTEGHIIARKTFLHDNGEGHSLTVRELRHCQSKSNITYTHGKSQGQAKKNAAAWHRETSLPDTEKSHCLTKEKVTVMQRQLVPSKREHRCLAMGNITAWYRET